MNTEPITLELLHAAASALLDVAASLVKRTGSSAAVIAALVRFDFHFLATSCLTSSRRKTVIDLPRWAAKTLNSVLLVGRQFQPNLFDAACYFVDHRIDRFLSSHWTTLSEELVCPR
jgi:hypothetical protein